MGGHRESHSQPSPFQGAVRKHRWPTDLGPGPTKEFVRELPTSRTLGDRTLAWPQTSPALGAVLARERAGETWEQGLVSLLLPSLTQSVRAISQVALPPALP